MNGNVVDQITDSIKMLYDPDNTNEHSEDNGTFIPFDLLHYIYAIMNSNKYRNKYHDKIVMDFPIIPYPTNQETFWKLVEIGGKLRECHLMQTEFDTAPYSFMGDGTNEVVKPEYKNERVYISKTQYFDNVPQAQWEQYIGGYQPLQKWLKDRKDKRTYDAGFGLRGVRTHALAQPVRHYGLIVPRIISVWCYM